MANKLKFEDQMKKLQDIVDKLEKEDIDLDESIHLYEEGLQLAKDLKKQLSVFEERIAELNKDEE
ncbi:MAG: exodeoxyribonuclease VII small subunit [Erysipelotrichaceae bacterium]|nr:exodeoxyribonuclease VII small subunit [Erysipelotrichaceae bacterium]MBQ1534668.1 exodeoxyribonuclease VII small subunit [Erysipelotrichaceae bacterium]MBQ2657383.1 exodeoxyribonuclease VII small subunit [Erysipelotrichaceae bacterium]MBQ5804156.1 exodeoxyribonuclease VII small subunit [Erysipelotrichaceae bacterium]MBR2533412.1 exodeoxyribonuclease VII small subunit [Erysipelotrichaceae bacterium]